MFAVAYKRRYLEGGSKWKYQYVIDATAERLIQELGVNPDEIETAYTLAETPEKRIKFQADIQEYVDMGISSTLNLPAWDTKLNNAKSARILADTIARYCTKLRGITAYPDGSRGGQPLIPVDYTTASTKRGVIFDEFEEKCSNGICGV